MDRVPIGAEIPMRIDTITLDNIRGLSHWAKDQNEYVLTFRDSEIRVDVMLTKELAVDLLEALTNFVRVMPR